MTKTPNFIHILSLVMLRAAYVCDECRQTQSCQGSFLTQHCENETKVIPG